MGRISCSHCSQGRWVYCAWTREGRGCLRTALTARDSARRSSQTRPARSMQSAGRRPTTSRAQHERFQRPPPPTSRRLQAMRTTWRWADFSDLRLRLRSGTPTIDPARAALIAGGPSRPPASCACPPLCRAAAGPRSPAIAWGWAVRCQGLTAGVPTNETPSLGHLAGGCPWLWVPSKGDVNNREDPPPVTAGGGSFVYRACRQPAVLA